MAMDMCAYRMEDNFEHTNFLVRVTSNIELCRPITKIYFVNRLPWTTQAKPYDFSHVESDTNMQPSKPQTQITYVI